MTESQLQGVDVFFWGAPTNEVRLSDQETSALVSFVQSGGVLLLESDSGGNDRVSANNAFEAALEVPEPSVTMLLLSGMLSILFQRR